ncbi:hypothetical protein SAMN04487965_1746 [Microbulbifer donghaiensis]|uniref:DUF4239 domain-containing protein n=1 Tax=Microbulbifer donghaiensis TaxID=494016 RepID=A0A1M5A540_9GAMM|nr:hypothetical protein [Microbulbifer donghaiensis]SHF25207.1 hypothetical protein SAMN04487965_1746 [Microbulbifer donghaiensis]
MNLSEFFHTLPLLVVYVFSVLLVLCALAVGLYLGRRHLRTDREIKDASIGSAVAATLGMLAFLLAFTFNMTASRFNDRKVLLLDEVNVIYTAYLRADFLQEPAAGRARQLLAEYAAIRDINPLKAAARDYAIARSAEIHREIWSLVSKHIRDGYDPGYLRQFVEPFNAVINDHNSRITVGLEYRIPGAIWVAIYFMTALAMLAIGFQFGVSRGGSLHVALALALTFSTVILLIADLDRSTEGTLLLDQRPMAELHLRLQEAEHRRTGGPPPVHDDG